jgi:hypothetical protein
MVMGKAWFLTMTMAALVSCMSTPTSSSGLTDTGGEGEGECTPDPDPIDAACVLCEPNANAPSISGSIVVAGTQPMPTASGGDPTGVWVGSDVTISVPEEAGAFVDVGASSFEGSGWIVFNQDGSFELLIDGEASVLLSGAEEPIVQAASAGAKGDYSVNGTSLSFSPDCQFSNAESQMAEGGSIRLESNPFSVTGSRMTLFVQITVQGFTLDVVLELDAA